MMSHLRIASKKHMKCREGILMRIAFQQHVNPTDNNKLTSNGMKREKEVL